MIEDLVSYVFEVLSLFAFSYKICWMCMIQGMKICNMDVFQ
jgi:hypothetical protein